MYIAVSISLFFLQQSASMQAEDCLLQSTVRILSGYFPEAYMLSRRGELHGRAVAFTDLVYTGFSL